MYKRVENSHHQATAENEWVSVGIPRVEVLHSWTEEGDAAVEGECDY